MARHDGNGWVRCGLGHRHWGKFGAAGLLACAPLAGEPAGPASSGDSGDSGDSAGPGGYQVLLARRGWGGHHGGSWGPPGGARDSHESAAAAAVREAAEECGIGPDAAQLRGVLRDDHGGWSYWTVIGGAAAPFPARAEHEVSDVAWVPASRVTELPLHPGFAAHWPALRQALAPVTIIVDVANVMGSRPDGWWRDRAGAAARLAGQLVPLAAGGLAQLPDGLAGPALERWYPGFLLVLEGAAKAALAGDHLTGDQVTGAAGRLRVVRAAGSGDNQIAALAAAAGGQRVVVTADRELRRRCQDAGAAVTGPRWLLAQL